VNKPSSDHDPAYVHPKKINLHVQLFQAQNYFGSVHVNAISKAESMLREHGLDLKCVPNKTLNMLPLDLVGTGKNGTFARSDYHAIRQETDFQMRLLGGPERLAIVFCQLEFISYGETPFEKTMWRRPFSLVSATFDGDSITMLHEMGHAAGLEHLHGVTSFMKEGGSRDAMLKTQILKLTKAFFAHS
jgi:hypothetical protein